MRRLSFCTFVLLVGSAALAAPPGALDGLNIPTDFADSTELGAQTNRTGFGNQVVTPGAFTPGSEVDGLFLAKDAEFLYLGVTGNLEQNGHAFVIFIDIRHAAFVGQTELRAEGVGGPPFTVQTASREIVITTNGAGPEDDVWSYGSNGTILPCEADFALAVDVFGGTMSLSRYTLFDPSVGSLGEFDPTPSNGLDLPNPQLYATRSFIGQSAINDGNDVLENQQDPNYSQAGFDDTNTSGVTESDASMADAATTGFEVAIPLADLGGGVTDSLNIFVALVDGSGFTGAIVPQTLPAITDDDVCTSGMAIGLRPDLTAMASCRAVTISALADFTGTCEGRIDPAEYGLGAALESQSCPTPYGDQQFDPDAVTPSNGSELNVLWVDNDNAFLYLGLTGNIERNGNTLHIFIDTDSEGADEGQYGPLMTTSWVPFQALKGMDGDTLPQDADDNPVFYNVAYGINLDGSNNNVYVDFWDLVNTNGDFRGFSQRDSGDGTLAGGTNPNGMQVALNNLNGAGVPGCGDGEACHLLTAGDVELLARSATLGWEIAVPLADLGLSVADLPLQFKLWTYITGGGGFGSDQGLPSMRNVSSNGLQVQNAGDGPNNYTDPFNPTLYRNFEARAAALTAYNAADFDKDGDVDLLDYDEFENCLAGPGARGGACTVNADLDDGGSVDLKDFQLFALWFTVP